MIRIIFRLVGAITLLATVAFSASLKQTRTGSPATSAPSMPPLTDRVVSEIQDFAKRTSITVPLLGQGKRIFVTSARGQIAYKTPKEGTNARYTPPPEFRSDIVVINCGNAEFGEIFECSRVRVRLPNKREIKPLSYLAQPNTYHNGFGAQWTVRTVLVKYSAPELRDGFSIEYASFDGTEWTFEVSAKQAEEILLLKCGDHGAEQCGQKPEETLVEQKVEEYFGRFTLGPSANVRSMAIPTPKNSVVEIHAGRPDTITVSFIATAEELREFYDKALPRYRWQPQHGECWSRPHPISAKSQVLCIDFSSANMALVRITESQ